MKKLEDYKRFYQVCTPRFLARETSQIQGKNEVNNGE